MKEQLQQICDQSNTRLEIMQALRIDYARGGGNYVKLNYMLNLYEIDLTKFKENHKKFIKNKKYRRFENDEIFINPSNAHNTTIRSRILMDNLISYECGICLNNGFHFNQKLVLQLDHINGNNKDNRIENLRFLCPNCHSQTITFAGRGMKNQKPRCYLVNEKNIAKKHEERKSFILSSKIDFKQKGWQEKIAKELKVDRNNLIKWIKKFMPEFYEETYHVHKIYLKQIDSDFKSKILSSNIKFDQPGWTINLSILLGISRQRANEWLRRNMHDFYLQHCWKSNAPKRTHSISPIL